jgi:ABC-2 type transport system permease protein
MKHFIMILKKIACVVKVLLKEQISEPFASLWILASPTAMFYFYLNQPNSGSNNQTYLTYSNWFYAYVAVTVSMFGFAYYLIGRRESGFVRSFIYNKRAQKLYFTGHIIAYSIVAVAYCLLFYLITKPAFGNYDFREFLTLALRFYIAFFSLTGFCALFSLLPIKFSSAGIFFSASSLLMIATSGLSRSLDGLSAINYANPLTYIEAILAAPSIDYWPLIVFLFNLACFRITLSNYQINPVWNRYS